MTQPQDRKKFPTAAEQPYLKKGKKSLSQLAADYAYQQALLENIRQRQEANSLPGS